MGNSLVRVIGVARTPLRQRQHEWRTTRRFDGSERAALTTWCDSMSADEQPSPFGDASWFDDQFGKDAPKPARGLPPPLRHALVLLGVAAVVAAAALAAGLTRDRHRGDASPATSTAVEVSSLRVVPSMAGVAVEVNGHRYTSRSDGSIPLDAPDRHGRAAIVEPQDISPAVRVAFSAWA